MIAEYKKDSRIYGRFLFGFWLLLCVVAFMSFLSNGSDVYPAPAETISMMRWFGIFGFIIYLWLFAASYVKAKGHKPAWALAAFLFFPLGLISLVFLKDISLEKSAKTQDHDGDA